MLSATQINHENVLSLKGIYVQDQEQNLEHLKLLAVNEHMEGLIDADSLLRSGMICNVAPVIPLSKAHQLRRLIQIRTCLYSFDCKWHAHASKV